MIICTDFNLDLKLYRIPSSIKKSIERRCDVKIIDFNLKDPLCKKAEIYWGNLIDDERIKILSNLKWIHLGSSGFDKIKKLESFKSIKLTNSRKIMSDAVSDSIFNFIFIFLRRYDQCHKLRYEKKLDRENFDIYFDQVRTINDCKFLIFGGGDISRNFISKLKNFSKKITLVSSNSRLSNKFNIIDIKKFKSLRLLDYDFVINILPHKKEYNDFFDKKFFKNMKKDSFFINVGRGSTVKEDDLYYILKNKKIAGSALDVFKDEPLKKNNPLLNLDNCLITPHISGMFNRYWIEQEKLFLFNLEKFLNGKKLTNIIKMKNE